MIRPPRHKGPKRGRSPHFIKKHRVLILFLGCLTALFSVVLSQQAYKRMADDPLIFKGLRATLGDVSDLSEIPIGLFMPSGEKNSVAGDVVRGVTLAVAEVNAGGGYRGLPFTLVRRWAEDPWAAGSREMVRLVYRDRVKAVIAFRGGADHIAQQVAAKVHVPVIAPVSSAVSLKSARVPWLLRLPPDDRATAKRLIREAIENKKFSRVGVVSGVDHDARMAGAVMVDEMEARRLSPVFHLQIESSAEADVREITERIRKFKIDVLAVCLERELLIKFLRLYRDSSKGCPVVLPWQPGVERDELTAIYGSSVYMPAPFLWDDIEKAYPGFIKAFRKRYGVTPSHSAFYGYESIQRLIRE